MNFDFSYVDVAFVNGKVITVDKNDSIAEAVGVKGNKICFVGKTEDLMKIVDEKTKVIDLKGRTLIVGGGSPPQLRRVQQRVIETAGVSYFNSANHDTTLTNVAARKGVCLAPGFLNDQSGEFAWTPFGCEETVPCVLCTHKQERRKEVLAFVKLLQGIYKSRPEFPV